MRSKICTVALTGLLTLGLAGGAAFAQEDTTTPPAQTNNNMNNMQNMNHHRGMNADRQLKRMTKQLTLSADQQSQIKPMLESQDQQMEQLRQDKTMSRQDRRQKMMSIRQDTSQKVEGVLNDTQKQKYEADQKRMRDRMMGQQHESQPEQQPQ